jgi:hypothetical protein
MGEHRVQARTGPPRSLRRRAVAGMLLASPLAACGAPARLAAVPRADTENATVLGGLPNARFFADTQADRLAGEAIAALERERAALGAAPGARLPPANFLAISGGSDDGAFGAGLLCGWTAAGTRPEFKLVTGVSTGALSAPFAFLGPEWDPQLRSVYTEIRPSDVFSMRGWLELPFGEAMTDTAALSRLISRFASRDILAAIAREYGKGRLLLIGTTNLDVQRPVMWNIGAIAASGHPGALDLFRRILLASAAVPVLFPPVMIEVELEGRPYAEMHVDGGAVAQSFLYPSTLRDLMVRRQLAAPRERNAFIIRNARLDPDWAPVDRRILSIAGRAIATMIHYSGHNDILRMQAAAERDGVNFRLAYIGPDFTVEHVDSFSPDYMRSLFDYGYRQALAGYPWRRSHPARDAAPPAVPPSRARS